MTTPQMLVLAALTRPRLTVLLRRLRPDPCRGRPWSPSRRQRVLIACAALRTNLTIRELAAAFAISKSTAHRIVATMTPQIADLADATSPRDRRESWVVDGTLIPTRDHRRAARSKNYRWSCNAQILARRRDLHIIATSGGGPGNRNDPIHYRSSEIEALCQRHPRVLADGGTAPSPSTSRPCFEATASCATARGAAIAVVEPGSSTRSPASRTGASYEIIAAAADTWLTR